MARKKAERDNNVGRTEVVPVADQEHIDHPLVDQAVHDINRLYTAKGLETARTIGEYVAEAFFGGDPTSFESKQKEHQSFQALSARDDLRVSKSFLWYSVKLLPQLKILPEDIAQALPMSHHRLLLHVGDDKLKLQLAQTAVAKDLSKRDFEAEVKEAKKGAGKPSKTGQKAFLAFEKSINRLQKVLEQNVDSFSDLDKVDTLPKAKALRFHRTVTEMKLKCEELQKALQGPAGL